MVFSHVKISGFLRVFKYDFSQWPKTLYNTYVYIIIYFIDIIYVFGNIHQWSKLGHLCTACAGRINVYYLEITFDEE